MYTKTDGIFPAEIFRESEIPSLSHIDFMLHKPWSMHKVGPMYPWYFRELGRRQNVNKVLLHATSHSYWIWYAWVTVSAIEFLWSAAADHNCAYIYIRHPANFTISARIASCTTLFTMQWQPHFNLYLNVDYNKTLLIRLP